MKSFSVKHTKTVGLKSTHQNVSKRKQQHISHNISDSSKHPHFMVFFHDNLGKLAPERYETFLDFINSRDDAVEVASAGPYANYLHLVPDS